MLGINPLNSETLSDEEELSMEMVASQSEGVADNLIR